MRIMHTLAIAVLLGSAACGGGSDATGVGNTNGGGTGAPGAVAVTIRDFTFTPANVTVKVGQSVRWTNQGGTTHTVTADDGSFDSGSIGAPGAPDPYGNGSAPGGSFTFVFNQAGTFHYHCKLHPPAQYPGFVGTVTVTP